MLGKSNQPWKPNGSSDRFGKPTVGFNKPSVGFGQPTGGWNKPTGGFGQPTGANEAALEQRADDPHCP